MFSCQCGENIFCVNLPQISMFKDKVEFWSCDCIVNETEWNQSEKVDHVAYNFWCVLQWFWSHQNDKKNGPVLVSNKHCAQKDVYGTTQTCGIKSCPEFL